MNSFENIREAIREGVTQGFVAQGKVAVRVASMSPRAKAGVTAALAAAVFALNSGYAWAVQCGGSNAAETLTKFISSAATFMIALGGAGALLMFAVGACFIIFGGTPSRVSKGMGMIKNAVIGLAILALGAFIKFVVLEFLSGATKNRSENSGCIKNGDL